MRPAEMREMDEPTLVQTLRELEEELAKLQLQNATHQLENPIQVRKVRRDVARCRTILRERRSDG